MSSENGEPKIYLLPNLMTAGNVFCGFAAVSRIIDAALTMHPGEAILFYHQALVFILGACLFDMLDGRLARLGGHESPFGREFDSLADMISFGLAPALLVYQIVLKDIPRMGWLIAFVYLLCGALRLARFNCYAIAKNDKPEKEFIGFPIPAAAGVIASLTLFMLWLKAGDKEIGNWKYALAGLMLFLAFMMFSRVRYPSFKGFGWRSRRSLPHFLLIIVGLVICVSFYEWMPALLFVSFLIYGFVRPFISKAMRHEIEDEDDEDEVEATEPTEQTDSKS